LLSLNFYRQRLSKLLCLIKEKPVSEVYCITSCVFDRLKDFFEHRIIRLDAPKKTGNGIEWPPNSPDLNVADFFLWCYLKDRVYKNSSKTLKELENNICTTIDAIPKDFLMRAMSNFEIRLRHVIVFNGGHPENQI